jgi:prepilin-type N-terminal cleavage/methylation domain-containing protein
MPICDNLFSFFFFCIAKKVDLGYDIKPVKSKLGEQKTRFAYPTSKRRKSDGKEAVIMTHKPKAFTLIELLVVIAIIALLMAILMPTLARVKKQAKSVTCQALLKQWGHIWSMYCQDNDGYFCMPADPTRVRWPRGNWINALRPLYRTKAGILKCPMAVKPHHTRDLGHRRGGPFNTYQMGEGGVEFREEEASFGANCWIYKPRRDSADTIQGRPVIWNWQSLDVRGGGNIPVFGDSMWRGGGPFYDGGAGSRRIIPPEFNGQWLGAGYEMMHFAIDRHNGFINHVFMDWSVRRLGIKELWTLKWHKQFNVNGAWTTAGAAQQSDWPEWMRNFKAY